MEPRATDKQPRHRRIAPSDEYFWERDRQGSIRDAREAEDCVVTMLRRLEAGPAAFKKGDPQYKHLIAYGMEVHLNIAWYLRKMKTERLKRFWLLLAVAMLAIFGLCAIPLFWRFGDQSHNDWNLIFFQLTAFPAAGFGILRVLSTMTDTRCRLGFFWKARSDLGEILYSFEHKWHGQVIAARMTEFWTDIDAGINAARQITREERQKFFDSLQSVGDVLSVAQQTVDGLAGRFPRRGFRMMPAQPAPPEPPEVAPPPSAPGAGV